MSHHYQHHQRGWYATSDYPNNYIVCAEERKPACQDILAAEAAAAINHNQYHHTYGDYGSHGSYSDYEMKHVPKIRDHHHSGWVKEHIHFEEDVDATIGATTYGCGSTYVEPHRGRRVKESVYFEEEVDAEADEFIELKHKNFERNKLRSMRRGF